MQNLELVKGNFLIISNGTSDKYIPIPADFKDCYIFNGFLIADGPNLVDILPEASKKQAKNALSECIAVHNA